MIEQHPFFVYGTLIPGQPNDHLWEDCIGRTEPATFRNGRLFDMGSFPMLIEGGSTPVIGQVMYPQAALSVKAYELLVQRLDNLENYDPDNSDNSPYYRVLRTVYTERDKTITAWVYLGRPHYTIGRPLINSGNWPHYSADSQSNISIWWQKREQGLLFGKNTDGRKGQTKW